MRFWPSCNCCGCEPSTLGSWSQVPDGNPVDPNADAEILAVDEFNQVQSVQLYAEATSADRVQGYHVRALFNDLLAGRSLPDVDMVSLFLDGGSHEVRLRYESFTAPHSWGFSCQHNVPNTILVQLWRGATKLNETRVVNNENTHGIEIQGVFGSLHGTTFCGGMNKDGGDVAHVETQTTSTHNGGACWVTILDKGGKYHHRTFNGGSIPQSEEIAVTSLVLTTCLTNCPVCSTCEDDTGYEGGGLVPEKPLSVFVPSYAMPLFSGSPISCSGGTFVLEHEGNCLWTHASDNALIYLFFATVSGTTRLRMRIASCLGYTCSGFETPVVQSWTSGPLGSPIVCVDFDAVELLMTVDGTTYTAEVSSIAP